MSKTCGTCCHWDGADDWGFCGLTASWNSQPNTQTSLAFATDRAGDEASLQTRDIFGCVQWKEKP